MSSASCADRLVACSRKLQAAKIKKWRIEFAISVLASDYSEKIRKLAELEDELKSAEEEIMLAEQAVEEIRAEISFAHKGRWLTSTEMVIVGQLELNAPRGA